MPARDTRNIEKAREKELEDIEQGRRIRVAADDRRGSSGRATVPTTRPALRSEVGSGDDDGSTDARSTPYAVSCRGPRRTRGQSGRAVAPSRGRLARPAVAVGASGAVVGAAVWRLLRRGSA